MRLQLGLRYGLGLVLAERPLVNDVVVSGVLENTRRDPWLRRGGSVKSALGQVQSNFKA